MTDDDDASDDPFEEMDAPDDVDPFEDLQGSETVDASRDRLPEQATAGDRDPIDALGDPADVDPRRSTSDDPFDSFSATDTAGGDDPFDAFEAVDVDSVDPDEVWSALSAAEAGETQPAAGEKVFSEVSKHRFCERCEHFTEPPTVACTYDGAAIVEFLDMETVRLVNCPIVAQQQDLENTNASFE